MSIAIAVGILVFAALELLAYHYLVLHGWGARFLAWYCRLPAPAPTAHAHWERSWDWRTRAGASALGLACVLMLAAAWSVSAPLGSGVTGAGEAVAAIIMRRSARRAAQAKGQAFHGHV